jgi:hypothetical protein
MSAIKIRDFQRLTGLSDSATLTLLASNELKCSIDDEGFIEIEAESVEVRQLIDAALSLQEVELTKEHGVIVEKIARIIGDQFSSIVEQAVVQARASGTSKS